MCLGNRLAPLHPPTSQTEGQVKYNPTSRPLAVAAAVHLRETPLPGAAGQRQQQEEDPTNDEDGTRTADTRHRPGELVVERNRVVAGQESQDGLVEDHEGQKHQDACRGDSGDRSICDINKLPSAEKIFNTERVFTDLTE